MALIQSTVPFNDSNSSIDPLADSLEIGHMTSPLKTTTHTTLDPVSARQAVKFNDLLISTPTRPSSRKGQSSPSKSNSQAESPWRIRVTVEAEREDVELGSQKTTRSTTSRIPLKGMGDENNTTAKSRGRPRKSGGDTPATRKRSGTPTPKKGGRRKSVGTAGSNEGEENNQNEDSTQRKPVGRPRKTRKATRDAHQETGATLSEIIDLSALTPMVKQSGGQVQRNKSTAFEISIDAEADNEIGIATNNETSIDSQGTKRAPLGISAENRVPSEPLEQGAGEVIMAKSSQIRSAEEEEARFTPVKKTPEKDRMKRCLNAGHTPLKSSALPTPSSSLLEDDGNESEHGVADTHAHEPELPSPFREFDTIMESEGFSMVSLDSLPSAKQQLSSPLTSQELSSSSKDARLSGQPQSSQRSQGAQTQLHFPSSPPEHSHLDMSSFREETPSLMNSTPQLPPMKPSQPTLAKKSTPKLSRVVWAGIALQGVLDTRKTTNALENPFSSPERTRSDPVTQQSPKERLDNLFRGFGPETQRELRAGLRFGEELAKRQRKAEQKKAEAQPTEPEEEQDTSAAYPSLPSSEGPQQLPSPVRTEHDYNEMSWKYDTPNTRRMEEREVQWQREREAISRQIEEANPSQVIVINSDDPTPSHLYQGMESEATDTTLQEQLQEDASQYDVDIWQQEALISDHQEDEEADIVQEEPPKPRRTKIPSPWRRGEIVPPSDDVTEEFSGIFYHGVGMSAVDPTRWAGGEKALDQRVDFSALLNPKDVVDPSDLFKAAYDTVESLGHAQAHQEVKPAERVGSDCSGPRGEADSSLDDEDAPDSPELGADSRSPMRGKLSRVIRGRTHVRFEMPVAGPKKEPAVEDSKKVEERHKTTEEPTRKERQSSAKIANSSKSEDVADSMPNTAKQSSWFGLVTSYLPSWRTSSPANVPDNSASETRPATKFDYPKANFVSLPPHGLPHPTAPLPTHGDWTNSHYQYLLLLYRHSLVHPEDFPLAPTADRSLLGKIVDAAGHTRPITELQLAIIEMWKSTISKGNEEMGWSGELEWGDYHIVKGLFCVEVGQVSRREEKRTKLLEEREKRKNERKKSTDEVQRHR